MPTPYHCKQQAIPSSPETDRRKLKTRALSAMIPLFANALFLGAAAAGADEVIDSRPDNATGQVLGGWASVLIGGAAAGPAGAIVGGLAGAWLGGEAQQAAGLSGERYVVKTDSGEIEDRRSPNHHFEKGDRVITAGIHLKPASSQLAAH